MPRPAATDGRSARAQRTGEAIVTALVELILAGDAQPTAQRIATRAGTSVRSVYMRFATLEALHRAAIARVTAMVLARLAPIDPAERLAVRIDLLCGQRARINEELGPLLAAAARAQADSPPLQRSQRFAHSASRQQIGRVFAAELAALEPGARRRRVAAVDALLGTPAWRALRYESQLGADEARVALREALTALLTAVPGREGGER